MPGTKNKWMVFKRWIQTWGDVWKQFWILTIFSPQELCDTTKCKILQQSIKVALGIEKEFISCFWKIPNSVIAQFNAELCYLKRYWQNRRGDWVYIVPPVNWKKIAGIDVTIGIKEFLKRKVVTNKVNLKSVGTNTDFVCTC